MIPDIMRKGPPPQTHKVLPEMKNPSGSKPLAEKRHLDTDQVREQYRVEHEQLEHLEFHHPYQEIRNQWSLSQLTQGIRPLHIGVIQDGSSTDTTGRKSTQFLLDHYHGQVNLIDISGAANPLSLILDQANNNLLTLLVGTRSQLVKMAPLLQQSPCPLLIVPDTQPLTQLKNVLVPCDATPFSYASLAQGLVCCEDFGSDLHVLHVSSTPQEQRIEHQEMTDLMEQMRWHDVSHDYLTVSGDVVARLESYCRLAKIDLVIMGTHRLKAASDSLTSELIAKGSSSIWVLHPN